jgi:hypothetical protein
VTEILLGAALAFVATLIVQFFVTPSADARRRRDEQWFQDVRSLLELIGGEIRPLLRSLQATDSLRSMRLDPEVNPNDGQFLRLMESVEEEHRERATALNALLVRGTWLSNRVLMVDEFNRDLMAADTDWDMARVHLQTEAYRPDSEVLTDSEQKAAWGKGEQRLNAAEARLLGLAVRARPPHRRRRFLRR